VVGVTSIFHRGQVSSRVRYQSVVAGGGDETHHGPGSVTDQSGEHADCGTLQFSPEEN